MKKEYILYIISDILGKGIPVLALMYLSLSLSSSEVEKTELIYVLQGLFINVLTLGQVHQYSKSLSFPNIKSSYIILFGPCLIFLILGIFLGNTILFLASIASIFQLIINFTQIYNNILGSTQTQRFLEFLTGVFYAITIFVFFKIEYVDYKLKVFSQIISLIILVLIFRNIITRAFSYFVFFSLKDLKSAFAFFLFSLSQWIILFFDKIAGRNLLLPEEADSYFFFSLITSTSVVINLSILKVERRKLHTIKNTKIQHKLISTYPIFIKSILINLFFGLFGVIGLFISQKTLSINLIFLNTLIAILYTSYNYLTNFIVQGSDKNIISINFMSIFNLSLILSSFFIIYILNSFNAFLILLVVHLIYLQLFLIKTLKKNG